MIKQLRTLVLACAATLILGAGGAQSMNVEITINKVVQKMTVRVDGEKEYVWPVSTGKKGYETPSGDFKPFRMEEEHYSKEWDDAPMPYSMFFTQYGHAIHGSMYINSLGRRASHGCVRLAPENAQILFDLVKEAGMQNTTIILKGGMFDSYNQPQREGEEVEVSTTESDDSVDKPTKPFFASLFGLASTGDHKKSNAGRKKDKAEDQVALKENGKQIVKLPKGAKKPEDKALKAPTKGDKKPVDGKGQKKSVAAKSPVKKKVPEAKPAAPATPATPAVVNPAPINIPPPPFMVNNPV